MVVACWRCHISILVEIWKYLDVRFVGVQTRTAVAPVVSFIQETGKKISFGGSCRQDIALPENQSTAWSRNKFYEGTALWS